MGIARRIYDAIKTELRGDPLNNPAIPVSSPAAWELFGSAYQTESGEIITTQNALQITTVYACVRVIAESIASLPLKLREKTEKGHREAVEQNLYYLLAAGPNPEMPAYTFMETLVGSMAIAGNGYAQIERNELGQPVALWPLHPFKTTPKRDPATRRIYYETSDGMPNGLTRIIAASDVIHVRLLSLDGLKGISPIDACRRSLGLAVAQEKSGARFFGNNSRPGGILMNRGLANPTKQLIQEMRQSWEAQQGAVNQGRIAVLPTGDWAYQALDIPNEASQWIQSRQMSRADIAEGIFRVPAYMVGDTSKLSGSNAEQMSLQFATYCLQPYLSNIEQEMVRKLIPKNGRNANRYFVRFNVDQLLRCDFKTQQEGYALGVQWGWYSANDVRIKLGENPGGPELDVYRTPVNYQNSAKLMLTTDEEEKPAQDSGDDTGVDAPVAPVDTPTEAERQLFETYSAAYGLLFRDAFTRISKRSKRDYDAFSTTFRPLLESIASMAVGFVDDADTAGDTAATEKIVDDTLKAMAKRSAKWPAQLSADELTSIAGLEFNKAVRSIHISTAQAVAAAKASSQLLNTAEKGNEQ